MKEREINQVAKILHEWNPLGERAAKISDLDGYRTEAIDIIFNLTMSNNKSAAPSIIRDILNQAFDLFLSDGDCTESAKKILKTIKKGR